MRPPVRNVEDAHVDVTLAYVGAGLGLLWALLAPTLGGFDGPPARGTPEMVLRVLLGLPFHAALVTASALARLHAGLAGGAVPLLMNLYGIAAGLVGGALLARYARRWPRGSSRGSSRLPRR